MKNISGFFALFICLQISYFAGYSSTNNSKIGPEEGEKGIAISIFDYF